MKSMLLTLCLVLLAAGVAAEEEPKIDFIRPVHTYSIVAYDSATGQFGAAVQSHYFRVADVIWAKASVGAVATQSLVDFRYGPLGIEMLTHDKSAQEAMTGLLASDENSHVRQVAMIDRDGHAVAHTGSHCIAEAGHYVGHHYSVQANLMEKNTVWDAMARAYESTEGELVDKMMAAMDAAEAEGGDIRGRQSAAILVVTGDPTGMEWKDRVYDLRVDDSPEPLIELRRLIGVQKAYRHMDAGDIAIEHGDFEKAEIEYSQAVELAPGNLEVRYWQAVTLVSVGEVDRALPIFKDIFEADERWRTLTPRLVDSEILPDDKEILDKIMGQ